MKAPLLESSFQSFGSRVNSSLSYKAKSAFLSNDGLSGSKLIKIFTGSVKLSFKITR